MIDRRAAFLLLGALAALQAAGAAERLAYPPAPRSEQVDEYHGVQVADPHRPLEDLDSAATRRWIEAENALTSSYLESVPERYAIRRRLTELWNYERWSPPFRKGDGYFFTRNDGLQNQSVLYTARSLDGPAAVLLDPNELSDDGTVALGAFAVSDDGKRLAYSLSTAGSDWLEWRVRDVETGRDLEDRIQWSKFSGASWSEDGKGFYYAAYEPPREGEEREEANYYQKLRYHRLGTPQSEDVIAYQRPDQKEWGFAGEVSEDGAYLVIHVWQGTDRRNRLFYRDLRDPQAGVVELLADFDASYSFVGNDGPVFWIQTDLEAPRGRLVAIDLRRPERSHWREVIRQAAQTLEEVSVVGERLLARYLEDARSRVKLFHLDGRPAGEIALPGLGTAAGFSGERGDRETFYSFESFTAPPAIYRHDLETGASRPVWRPRLSFDPDAYETRQVFYRSKDGTRVPMLLSHRKGLRSPGQAPALLFGYGGFNLPQKPAFKVPALVWMERGGLYAVANLRGGGEYGEEWHEAGTKLKKQNVFDDFIAAAEWLVAEGWTRPERLGITGRSNGGLLVGASLVQRPDLFGAAVPEVGVLDMLRFHKFTIGWAWVSDYGSPDDPEEFRALYAYSPYHNLRPGTAYPATFITTGDHDDRVVPAHSFKFAAALQAAQAGPEPILIRIDTRAGHGAGKPTAKRIEEAADILSFLVRELGLEAAPTAAGP